MPRKSRSAIFVASAPFWILSAFFAILWMAGGASRADVSGQAVVRFAAWIILIILSFVLQQSNWKSVRVPATILAGAVLIVAVQLVPLPPSLWLELPGRQLFADAATLAGYQQPWRPVSISPSGTGNALASLVVPAVVLLLAAQLNSEQHQKLFPVLLLLVGGGALLGLLQFSGVRFDNPFINEFVGQVSGNFANANHFALFLAMGCTLALAWAFNRGSPKWNVLIALSLLVLFTLMILATGSRTGVLLDLLGILLGAALVMRRAQRQFGELPRPLAIGLATVGAFLFALTVWISISQDRAVSINRAAFLQSGLESRGEIWSTTVSMIHRYFPVGSGFGTFDPVFRITEPDKLLRTVYVNQAHNDWLQTILEGGLPGAILLIAAVAWFGWRCIVIWRPAGSVDLANRYLARTGSILVILTMVASVPDYPARTPMIMAILALSGAWIAVGGRSKVSKNTEER